MTEAFDVQQGITGELREKLAEYEPQETGDEFIAHPIGEVGYDIMMALCDSIDAVHANLERENAELKAELDRVLGEHEEHTHTRGGSITDELRKYAQDWRETPNLMDDLDAGDIDALLGDFEHIADRIDAEYEDAIQQALMGEGGVPATDENMAEHGWVRGPLDADGKMWRSGDMSDSIWGVIEGIAYGNGRWLVRGHDTSAPWIPANSISHYHAPTVEDVLREFALDVCKDDALTIREGVVEKYAAKLCLAGDEE